MTMERSDCTPTCPSCGNPTPRKGWHCLACLEQAMKDMTPEDWSKAIGEVCDHVLRADGESETP